MHRRKSMLVAVILAILISGTAGAEIYKCDGKWTNQPCDGKVEEKLADAPLRRSDPVAGARFDDENENTAGSESADSAPLADRIEIVRKLTKQSDDSAKPLSKGELASLKSLCMDTKKKFQDCQSAYDKAMAKLESNSKTAEDELVGKMQ